MKVNSLVVISNTLYRLYKGKMLMFSLTFAALVPLTAFSIVITSPLARETTGRLKSVRYRLQNTFNLPVHPTCRLPSRTMNRAHHCTRLIDFHYAHCALNVYALATLLTLMLRWHGTLHLSTLDRLSHCLLLNGL